jgi:peroxiredoxin
MPESSMTSLSTADTDRLRQAFLRCRDMEGTLGEQLEAYAAAGREIFPAYSEAVDRLVARIHENGGGENAPRPGEAMPPFLLPDVTGRLVSLTSLLERGPLAVMFFRGHWCPYCRLNVAGLAEIAPEVENLGARIVAISPEKARYGKELKSYANAPFPVLADINNAYALELNLLFWVGDEKREAMQAGGYDIAPYQGNDAWMLPIPATFIVDRDGVVKARYIDPDYRRRMDLDELLAALRSVVETTR